MFDGIYLQNEGPGSGFQSAAGCVNRIVARQDDYFRVFKVTPNLFGKIQPVKAGQAKIDDGDVGVS